MIKLSGDLLKAYNSVDRLELVSSRKRTVQGLQSDRVLAVFMDQNLYIEAVVSSGVTNLNVFRDYGYNNNSIQTIVVDKPIYDMIVSNGDTLVVVTVDGSIYLYKADPSTNLLITTPTKYSSVLTLDHQIRLKISNDGNFVYFSHYQNLIFLDIKAQTFKYFSLDNFITDVTTYSLNNVRYFVINLEGPSHKSLGVYTINSTSNGLTKVSSINIPIEVFPDDDVLQTVNFIEYDSFRNKLIVAIYTGIFYSLDINKDNSFGKFTNLGTVFGQIERILMTSSYIFLMHDMNYISVLNMDLGGNADIITLDSTPTNMLVDDLFLVVYVDKEEINLYKLFEAPSVKLDKSYVEKRFISDSSSKYFLNTHLTLDHGSNKLIKDVTKYNIDVSFRNGNDVASSYFPETHQGLNVYVPLNDIDTIMKEKSFNLGDKGITYTVSNDVFSVTNDSLTEYIAYSWSADGSDRFTTVYPNLNLSTDTKLFTDGKTASASKKGQVVVNGNATVTSLAGFNYATFTSQGSQNQDWFRVFLIPDTPTPLMDKSEVLPNTKYTFSFFAKGTGTHRIIAYNNWAVAPNNFMDITLTSDWKLYTLTVTSMATIPTNNVQFFFRSSTAGSVISVMKPKPELGSTATPWMPSASEVKDSDYPSFVGRKQINSTTPLDINNPNWYTWSMNKPNNPVTPNNVIGTNTDLIKKIFIKDLYCFNGDSSSTDYTNIAYFRLRYLLKDTFSLKITIDNSSILIRNDSSTFTDNFNYIYDYTKETPNLADKYSWIKFGHLNFSSGKHVKFDLYDNSKLVDSYETNIEMSAKDPLKETSGTIDGDVTSIEKNYLMELESDYKSDDRYSKNYRNAYAWSADGKDRFTTVYPNLNLLKNTKSQSYTSTGTTNNSSSVIYPLDGVVADLLNKQIIITYNYAITNSSGTWSGIIRPTYGLGGTNQSVSNNNLSGTHKETATYTSIGQSSYGILVSGLPAGTTVTITNLKIEFGSTATPWMPSASEVKSSDYPTFKGTYLIPENTDLSTVNLNLPSTYIWQSTSFIESQPTNKEYLAHMGMVASEAVTTLDKVKVNTKTYIGTELNDQKRSGYLEFFGQYDSYQYKTNSLLSDIYIDGKHLYRKYGRQKDTLEGSVNTYYPMSLIQDFIDDNSYMDAFRYREGEKKQGCRRAIPSCLQ
jgi:hypothetical protein